MKLIETIIIITCLMIAGCATMFKGGFEEVEFNSDPPRAKVFINGQDRGITPLSLKLETNMTYSIRIEADGYHPHTTEITNSVGAGWIILDILAGLVPIIIDAATGDWYSLSQENVNAVLIKQQLVPSEFFQ